MGSIAEACDRDADVWSYGDGILSLTFNDIWDGSSVDANTGAANITSANKCSSFDLVRNGKTCFGSSFLKYFFYFLSFLGYDVAYKTVDWTLDLDLRTAITIAALDKGIITEEDLVVVTEEVNSCCSCL